MISKELLDSIEFSKKHHTYHYQEAHEFFLLAFYNFKLNRIDDAKFHLEKSFFHLPYDNHDANFLKTLIDCSIFDNDEIKIKCKLDNKFNIYDNNIVNELEIINNYFILEKYEDLINIVTNFNKHTSSKHFEYHCNLADMYFNIAKNHFESGRDDVKYFILKAIETDKRNPKIVEYNKFLCDIKL